MIKKLILITITLAIGTQAALGQTGVHVILLDCSKYECAPDIGIGINKAYADCSANGSGGGCKIIVPEKSDGTCWNFSTPIIFHANDKAVLLVGDGTASAVGGVCLNYTPTESTAAITIDYTPNSGPGFARAGGIRDLTLMNNNCVTPGGCGSSATGLSFGGVGSGGAFANFEHLRIMGFGTAVSWVSTSSFGQVWHDYSIVNNTTGLSIEPPIVLENMSFTGGFIANNRIGASIAGGGDWKFNDTSFDDNQILAISAGPGGAPIICTNCHFENRQGGTSHYIQATGFSDITLIGGSMGDDPETGTTDWWIKTSGYELDVSETIIQSAGRSVVEVVEADSPVRAKLAFINASPTSGTPTIYGGSSSKVTNLSWNYGASPTTPTLTFEMPLALPQISTRIYTVSTLPAAPSVTPGTQVVVSDATSYTPGPCAGGGGDYMIAVSDGSKWTCH